MLKYRCFDVISFLALCILNSDGKINIENYLLMSQRILLLHFYFLDNTLTMDYVARALCKIVNVSAQLFQLLIEGGFFWSF